MLLRGRARGNKRDVLEIAHRCFEQNCWENNIHKQQRSLSFWKRPASRPGRPPGAPSRRCGRGQLPRAGGPGSRLTHPPLRDQHLAAHRGIFCTTRKTPAILATQYQNKVFINISKGTSLPKKPAKSICLLCLFCLYRQQEHTRSFAAVRVESCAADHSVPLWSKYICHFC